MSQTITTTRRDHLDLKGISERLGGNWTLELLGDDSVRYHGPDRTIIVSYDPDTEPGVDWVHASISYHVEWRIPCYADLKQMHAAIFPGGHAYQCFVPCGEHINIRSNVLHLWGRLDGSPALPNFDRMGSI